MPLLGPDQRFEEELPAAIEQPEAGERAGVLDVAASAFRQGNFVSSLYDRVTLPNRPDRKEAGYDPLDDIAGFEPHAMRFLDADSPEEVAWLKMRITREMQDREVLQQAGGWGLASTIGAGVVDPTTLLAMAIPVSIPVAGGSRAAAVGRAVAAQVAFDTTAEIGFHQVQETRTLGESALNVGAGAILTGILGGALASRIPAEEFEALRTNLARDLSDAPGPEVEPATMRQMLDEYDAELHPDELYINPGDASTVGAAAAGITSRTDETLARGARFIDATLGHVSPGARLLRSPSVNARRMVQSLAETPELMNKNLKGIASEVPVESILKRYQGDWWQAYKAKADLYAKYRKRMRAEGGERLSRRQFNEEISYAMRRGDESPIPEVQQAAAVYRRTVYEPLKKRAQQLGLLDEEVQVVGAESYLMRQYSVGKIRADMRGWLQTLREGFEKQGLDRLDALELAHKVTRNITGSEKGTLDWRVLGDAVPASGRLKQREIRLPDEVLEPWLNNDIDSLSLAYIRTLAPEVEMTARFGDRELKEAMEDITGEYVILKQRARSDKEIAAIAKREERDLNDLRAIRDRLYGIFGAPKDPSRFFVRAGRLTRSLNYTRLLGGQTISAITDLGRMIVTYGSPRMMASAMKLATNIKGIKLARATARRMGVGLDLVLNTRGIAIGDVSEYSSFAEQAIARKVSNAFSIVSLQSPWNAVMKSWVSVMSQDDILRAAAKVTAGKPLSKQVTARMAQLSMDEAMLRRIAKEAGEHGVETRGLRFAMSEQWKDAEAAQVFENAVIREADTAVLTPGVGDLPLVHSTEWGKAILQFKSFGISATRRWLAPIAQGAALGDMKAYTGATSILGLGAVVYTLKQLAAGRPIEDDPTRFALEMVDRSGLLAWGGDVLFPSLWQLGSDDFSRWSDRQPVETILGPVAGTVADAYTTRWPARLLDGDVSQADVHKVRRLLPGQNLFYLRRAFNELEEEVAP